MLLLVAVGVKPAARVRGDAAPARPGSPTGEADRWGRQGALLMLLPLLAGSRYATSVGPRAPHGGRGPPRAPLSEAADGWSRKARPRLHTMEGGSGCWLARPD